MKLSFSTLGCPTWTIDEIIENAKNYGFQGIGIRGIQGEFDLTKLEAFNDANRAKTLEKLRNAGLTLTILKTSAKFTSPDQAEWQKNLDDAKAGIDLAQKCGSPLIRVFGGRIPEGVTREAANANVVRALKALGEYAKDKNVVVTVETHDDYSDTKIVREIMDSTDHPNVGVLWDVHHPYRACGQGMQECWDNIGKYVVHTHFKDSKVDPSEKLGYKYCLLGDGDVPNIEAMQILKDAGYDGFMTLEWEKAWHDYLPDASIGFPQFVKKMREYEAQLK